jgi:hypothetical protein
MKEQRTVPLLRDLISIEVTSFDGKGINYMFLESLDEVLVDLLGRRVRDAFYDHIEAHYYMTRSEIPGHLNDFLLILERTFGKSGKTIEGTIARRLCAKLEHPSRSKP